MLLLTDWPLPFSENNFDENILCYCCFDIIIIIYLFIYLFYVAINVLNFHHLMMTYNWDETCRLKDTNCGKFLFSVMEDEEFLLNV
jgi:hypothetical protein